MEQSLAKSSKNVLVCVYNVETERGLNMSAKVQKWGNSLAFRIPKALALEVGLDIGSKVELLSADGELRIVPIEEPYYDLDELLASVPDDYEPEEWDVGPAVGKEVWW